MMKSSSKIEFEKEKSEASDQENFIDGDFQKNEYGYIETKRNENESLKWLDSFDKKKVKIEDVMKRYQNDVLL